MIAANNRVLLLRKYVEAFPATGILTDHGSICSVELVEATTSPLNIPAQALTIRENKTTKTIRV
jgi:hypothetical protein